MDGLSGKLRGAALGMVAILGVGAALPAQDVAPLIRDREPAVTVTTGRSQRPGQQATPTPIPTPRPDPNTVIVALVNTHTITRAQLDRRLAGFLGKSREQLRPEDLIGPVTKSATKDLVASLADNPNLRLEQVIMAEQQQFEIEEAIRNQEEEIVYEWVDQMMLAEEARRQGLLISDRELQDRMKQLETEFKLRDPRVSSILDAFGMTSNEFESYIYDALLIEKLLDRYVQLNYTEEMLRQAYNINPMTFYTPPARRVAHFVVTLSPGDTARDHERFKTLADKVRQRLAKGEDPQKVFDEENDLELGIFGAEFTYSLGSRLLEKGVLETMAKMKDGEVSRVLAVSERSSSGEVTPLSYHVIKVMESIPEKGRTFEEALPTLRRATAEMAREEVLLLIRNARTHRVFINFKGIPPDRIPDAAELRKPQPPIALKL